MRISASSAQQRLAQSEGLAERLAKAGGSLSAELGRRRGAAKMAAGFPGRFQWAWTACSVLWFLVLGFR